MCFLASLSFSPTLTCKIGYCVFRSEAFCRRAHASSLVLSVCVCVCVCVCEREREKVCVSNIQQTLKNNVTKIIKGCKIRLAKSHDTVGTRVLTIGTVYRGVRCENLGYV